MINISTRISNKIANMGMVCAVLVVSILVPSIGVLDKGAIISDYIARIAVPYFFVVSGFLLACHCNQE